VLCVSLLAIVIDNTIVNVALPTLVRDLSADDSELQWVVDAWWFGAHAVVVELALWYKETRRPVSN
jgi:hypothetical protein